MGHLVFIVLHLAALVFGLFALVITIPLHIIYAAVKANAGTAGAPHKNPARAGLKPCPDCAELIKIEARKCKHCGREIGEAENYRLWMDSLAPCCRERVKYGNSRCITCGRKLIYPKATPAAA